MTGIQYIVLLSFTSVLSIYLAFLSNRKKQAPGARSLAMLMINIGIWTIGMACQMLAEPFVLKMLFHDFMYIGITLTPPLFFNFVVNRHMLLYLHSVKRRVLLFSFPVLSLLILFTNSYHHLFYNAVTLIPVAPFSIIIGQLGSWFWLHTTYSYLLILASFVITLYQFHIQSSHYRKQTLLILLAIAFPVIMNLFYLSIGKNNAVLDMTPISLLLTGLLFFLSISSLHLFDFSPITKQLVYQYVEDIILVLDLNNRIIDYNHAFSKLVNCTTHHITGRHIASFYKEAGLSNEEIEKINKGSSTFKVLKDQSYRYYRIQDSNIYKNNDVIAKLYLIQDITDIENYLIRLEEASSRLRQSTEAKSRYLSDLSHEIRTPIHGIIGISHHLLENQKQQEFELTTKKIHNAAHRILDTVNTVLDYSKLEAQKMQPLEEVFSLHTFKTTFEKEVRYLNPKLEFDDSLDLAKSFYRGNLKHAIQILSLYMKELHGLLGKVDFHLTVSCGSHETLDFIIGCPCSERKAQSIKKVFWESEHHLTEADGLNPIYFALCMKLIAFCKGSFRIDHQNAILLFTCSLPFEHTIGTTQEQEQNLEGFIKHPFVIAVVDDSSINQSIIKNQLKETAFVIECFSSGRDVLRAIETKTFHLILTDLSMPDFSGYDLAQTLRSRGFENLPIVAISASDKTDLQSEQAHLFKDFVSKPFKRTQLIEAIARALS